jgi:hypothetical protein
VCIKSSIDCVEQAHAKGSTMPNVFSKPRLEGMARVMTGHVERAELPGFVALVSRHGETTRILARPSVELMTTDQLTPEQKEKSGMTPGDFDAMVSGSGWR